MYSKLMEDTYHPMLTCSCSKRFGSTQDCVWNQPALDWIGSSRAKGANGHKSIKIKMICQIFMGTSQHSFVSINRQRQILWTTFWEVIAMKVNWNQNPWLLARCIQGLGSWDITFGSDQLLLDRSLKSIMLQSCCLWICLSNCLSYPLWEFMELGHPWNHQMTTYSVRWTRC